MRSALARFGHFLARVERLVIGRKAYKWVLRTWEPLRDIEVAADLLATMRFTRQIAPQELDGPRAERILVIAPHPDDEVIGPGGTLIAAAKRGARVTVLYLTSGEAKEGDRREREARSVCDRCGFEPRFAGQSAGGIVLEDSAEAIARAVLECRPQAVFTPFLLDDHDDHRRASHALAIASRDHGGLGAPEIWAYQVYTPLPGNVVVDVTGLGEEKAGAIRLYRSQMARRDWAHFALGLNAFNCRLLHGRPAPCLVESFFVAPLEDYVALCQPYFGSGKAYDLPAYRSHGAGAPEG